MVPAPSVIPYPDIEPVALALGPVRVHWYGIMYLLSFIGIWCLMLVRSRHSWSPIRTDQIEDLIFYGVLGVVLGGRLGYVFFYQPGYFLEEPLWLFRIWEGGMAFHGGLLGVMVALYVVSRKAGTGFLHMSDFVAPMVPVGLFLGRIGNFIGQELWGRPTDGWWAMVFPNDPEALPRHPSQLYEAALEGLVLFAILWWISGRPRPVGLVSGLFLLGYGVFRFFVEFVREPDAHLADILIFGWVTRGQALSFPMILAGLVMVVWALRRPVFSSHK